MRQHRFNPMRTCDFTHKEVFLVNRRLPGNLLRTLNGENPGSRIYKAE